MSDAERIKAAIGYEPISVSIDGYPQIRETYRTVTDRDALVERLLPVLREVRNETRKDIARRIFELEQEIQALLVRSAGDPRLAGALAALQHARDIAEGVTDG